MPEIIFAKPRHEYGSYRDFWRLVELSGFPTVFIDEIDPASDNTYIISTPDASWNTDRVGWPGARARIIYYLLEWYEDVREDVPGLAEVWSPDAWFAYRFGYRYVPMGSHAGLKLYDTPPNGRVYDVATLWYEVGRRAHIRHQLEQFGVKPSPVEAWDEARHNLLMQSRCMVMVHQHDHLPVVAPSRWALAAAYSLPIITETLGNDGIFKYSFRLMSSFDYLAQFTRDRLRDANLADYGRALHGLLCRDYTFRKGIEAAV